MRRSVVLVHGIFDTGLVFSSMARHLENWGFRCYIPTLRPSTGTKGLDSSLLGCRQESHRNEEPGISGPDAEYRSPFN